MLLKSKQDSRRSNSTLLLFPAEAPLWEDKEFFFLFSIHQVISVLNQKSLPSESNRSARIVGEAKWRGNDLPLLSIENCLGLPAAETAIDQRIVAIREVYRDEDNEIRDLYALCRLGAATRRLQFPFDSRPIAVPNCIRQPSFLKGVYEMEKYILLVIHLRQILESLALIDEKIVGT